MACERVTLPNGFIDVDLDDAEAALLLHKLSRAIRLQQAARDGGA